MQTTVTQQVLAFDLDYARRQLALYFDAIGRTSPDDDVLLRLNTITYRHYRDEVARLEALIGAARGGWRDTHGH
jgi:hypothetical protein